MRRTLVTAVVVLTLVGACGGGGGDDDGADAAPTTTQFDRAKAMTDIKDMWTTQFNAAQTVDGAVGLIENGTAYREAIQQQEDSGATSGLSVVVKDVQLTNNKLGTVTYDIVINGNVALANTKGNAVFVDGKWKVSEQHFCVLLNLGNIHPPACEKLVS
jgi:hypothetical protein